MKKLTFYEACEYINITWANLTDLVANGKIPYHKEDKKIIFFKEEIDNFYSLTEAL